MATLTAAAVLAATAFAAQSHAGPIDIADFSGSESVSTFDSLPLPFFNPTPLIIDGNTYTTDNDVIRYFTFVPCSGFCIGNDTDEGYIDVVLGTAATRVGGRVGNDTSWSARVEFYDGSDLLLGAVDLSDDTGLLFAGWEDAGGIARMRIVDLADNGFITQLDDFRWEAEVAIPESAAIGLFGLGLVLAGATRRLRKS